MAKRVAKFEKVSFDQFGEDWFDTFKDIPELCRMEYIIDTYAKLQLPTRATKFSAGYDFKSPLPFTLHPNETIKIPTGIRCSMNTDWVLKLYPRSSLGFKYRIRLENSTGIIDSDYFYSDNEGHIFIKITNCGEKTCSVNAGDGFAQGVFVEYGITEDDDVKISRNGGIGSTDDKKE